MTVRVKRVGSNSGNVRGVTFFADDFNRAAAPAAQLGPNWVRVREFAVPQNTPFGFPDSFLTGTALAINGSGLNNPNYQVQGFVAAIPTRNGTRGATRQFAQAKLVSRSGPQAQAGICVLIDDNVCDCYSAFIDFGGGPFNLNLGRTNQTTFVGIGGPFGTVAAGDILRLTVDNLTTPGTSIVKVFKNGTLAGTVNDNSGSRLTAGYTGGFYQFRMGISGGVADLSTWDDFSCGIGL